MMDNFNLLENYYFYQLFKKKFDFFLRSTNHSEDVPFKCNALRWLEKKVVKEGIEGDVC